MLLLIPATCIGQGTWNTRQDFDEGIRIVGNVTVDNIYVSAGDTIVSIAGHDFLLSDIRLKLYVADTSGMLTPYALLSEVILPADTAAMLAPYLITADVAGKLDVSDTAAMLTPYLHYTEAILPADTSTMLTNYSLLSEVILPADTAAMLTPYAQLDEAILPADTAAMLANYAQLDEAILPADTAAMLLPYAQLYEVILPADTAAMLTPYAQLDEAILPADTAAMLANYALLSEANSAFNSGSGITIDGSNNIDLGSALDAPTIISGTEVNNLSLNFSDAADRSAKLVFRPADGLSMRGYSGDAYNQDSGFFAVDSNLVTMAQYKGASRKSITMDTATATGIVVRDYVAGKGLVFFDDYSPSYGDRSATDYAYQITHLGGQAVNATVYNPGPSQHGGVMVYDSTGYATGTDYYKIEPFVPAEESAGIMLTSCDTIHFSVTTVDTLLTLAEGAVIWDIQVFIKTSFDGSGTNLLDVGIIGDGDKYENDLDLDVASNFYGLANVADRMPAARYITCQYFDSNADAANGEAYIYVHYSIH